MKLEALLATATDTSEEQWNLSEWSCYETLDRAALIQEVHAALLEGRTPISQFYPLDNVQLLALFHPSAQLARTDAVDDIGVSTRLGLSNFIKHLAPINPLDVINKPDDAFPERPQTPKHTFAYDIGDMFYNLGVKTTQLYPQDGSVLMSQELRQTEATPFVILSLQKVNFSIQCSTTYSFAYHVRDLSMQLCTCALLVARLNHPASRHTLATAPHWPS